MGIIILKGYWFLLANFKKVFFKIIFGNRLIIGNQTRFRESFNVYIDNQAYVSIGNGCFFNHACSINALKKIVIGDNCIFGENVKIYDHNHKFNKDELIKVQGFSVGEVTIGNNCWIGSNVIILKDVSIGNNVVIGAGCIIDSNVPDNVVCTTNRNLYKSDIVYKN